MNKVGHKDIFNPFIASEMMEVGDRLVSQDNHNEFFHVWRKLKEGVMSKVSYTTYPVLARMDTDRYAFNKHTKQWICNFDAAGNKFQIYAEDTGRHLEQVPSQVPTFEQIDNAPYQYTT